MYTPNTNYNIVHFFFSTRKFSYTMIDLAWYRLEHLHRWLSIYRHSTTEMRSKNIRKVLKVRQPKCMQENSIIPVQTGNDLSLQKTCSLYESFQEELQDKLITTLFRLIKILASQYFD